MTANRGMSTNQRPRFIGTLIFGIALTTFLVANLADALVAITNGNYFTGFVDLNHPNAGPGFQLKLERTYNSRSQYNGIFGYGWGTEFESFLVPAADGSVVIQESGGGEKTRFTPKGFSNGDMNKFITELIKAKQKKQGGGFNAQAYTAKLKKDADFRDEEGRTLGVMPMVKTGTKLYSTQRGDKQVVTVIKGGFVREFGTGKMVYFTKRASVRDFGVEVSRQRVVKGVYKITRFVDKVQGVDLSFKYDETGKLVAITDGGKQTLRFVTNTDGKVKQATDHLGRASTYKYCRSRRYNSAQKCSAGDLVYSKDGAGNEFIYEYDNIHNLTKIKYSDGSFEEISYYPASPPGEGGAKEVKLRRGVKMKYTYWSDPKDKRMHFKTTVETTYRSGRKTIASYEYWRKRRSDGTVYKQKMATNINGDKTVTTYNECCGQPLEIKRSSGTTTFAYYDDTGLPKLKNSPTEKVGWKYSKQFHGKVTQVAVLDKTKGQKKALITKYQYNAKGNLVRAKTSDGRGVGLLYDSKNRIKAMIDQEKRKITFTYNSLSKPVKITQQGVGGITVEYDGKGSIKEVNSKGGRQIALSVTAAFQNLLEIIKPAGVQPL